MSCQALLEQKWVAPPEDPDINWNPEDGTTTVTFTDEVLRINILTDPACRKLPDIGPLISQLVAQAG